MKEETNLREAMILIDKEIEALGRELANLKSAKGLIGMRKTAGGYGFEDHYERWHRESPTSHKEFLKERVKEILGSGTQERYTLKDIMRELVKSGWVSKSKNPMQVVANSLLLLRKEGRVLKVRPAEPLEGGKGQSAFMFQPINRMLKSSRDDDVMIG